MTATAAAANADVGERSAAPAMRSRFSRTAVVTVEALIAAVVMSYALDRRSFWLDEATTAGILHRPWQSTVRIAVLEAPSSGLYHVIARGWTVFGDSEVALRSLSVVVGIAVVPVVYSTAARLFGQRAGLVAAILIALNTTVVAVAQQARQYAFVVLLVSAASLCFVRAVERATWGSWLLYVVVAALAIYVNVVDGFVIAAHFASLLVLTRSTVPWRRVFTAAGVIAVLVLPFILALRRHGDAGLEWIKSPTVHDVERALESFAGGTWYVLVLSLVACAVAVASAATRWARAHDRADVWRTVFVAAWLVAPLLGALVGSVLHPMFVARYVIGALPALTILTAVGVTLIRPRVLGVCLLAVLLAVDTVLLANWFESEKPVAHTTVPREDWRAAVAYVLARSLRSDAVVLQAGYVETTWSYYLRRDGTPPNAPLQVSDASWSPPLDARQLRSIGPAHPRVWLLVGHVDPQVRRVIRDRFAQRYDLASTRHFLGDIDVLRYDARD